jgi:hypothetical protein
MATRRNGKQYNKGTESITGQTVAGLMFLLAAAKKQQEQLACRCWCEWASAQWAQ